MYSARHDILRNTFRILLATSCFRTSQNMRLSQLWQRDCWISRSVDFWYCSVINDVGQMPGQCQISLLLDAEGCMLLRFLRGPGWALIWASTASCCLWLSSIPQFLPAQDSYKAGFSRTSWAWDLVRHCSNSRMTKQIWDVAEGRALAVGTGHGARNLPGLRKLLSQVLVVAATSFLYLSRGSTLHHVRSAGVPCIPPHCFGVILPIQLGCPSWHEMSLCSKATPFIPDWELTQQLGRCVFEDASRVLPHTVQAAYTPLPFRGG